MGKYVKKGTYKNKQFECPICTKKFSSQYHLDSHLFTHTKEYDKVKSEIEEKKRIEDEKRQKQKELEQREKELKQKELERQKSLTAEQKTNEEIINFVEKHRGSRTMKRETANYMIDLFVRKTGKPRQSPECPQCLNFVWRVLESNYIELMKK